MPNRSSWGGFVRRAARIAGRKYAEARRAYEEGQQSTTAEWDLPTDERGDARIVCRRHAEKRTVAVDPSGRPECYEVDHPDCEGCVEDVRAGRVETW